MFWSLDTMIIIFHVNRDSASVYVGTAIEIAKSWNGLGAPPRARTAPIWNLSPPLEKSVLYPLILPDNTQLSPYILLDSSSLQTVASLHILILIRLMSHMFFVSGQIVFSFPSIPRLFTFHTHTQTLPQIWIYFIPRLFSVSRWHWCLLRRFIILYQLTLM